MGTIDGSTKQGVLCTMCGLPVIIQTQSLSDVQQSPKTAVSRYDAAIRVNVKPKRYVYDRPAALATAAEGLKAADTGAVLMTDIRTIASDAKLEHLFQDCQLHHFQVTSFHTLLSRSRP